MKQLDCVSQISIFEGLPKRLLRQVGALCRERRYPAGRIIIKEGSEGIGLFFLLEGRVEVFGTARNGKERHLAELGPGEYFGEMMVIDRAPRSASVRAVEPVLCYLMAQWDFRRLLKRHPEIAFRMLPVLVNRIRNLDTSVLH